MSPQEETTQRRKIFISLYIPALFVVVMGLIHLIQFTLNTHWYQWAVEPRTVKGLRGIIFSPLLHSDWEHYISNAIPLLILGAVAIFFYRWVAYRVLLWVWLVDGVGVWLFGRDSYHLGASGLVYGLAAFLLFSGLLRKNRSLTAISFFVIVGYGGLIWGMLPLLPHISWEAHLFGFLAGIGLSVLYLKQGPQNDTLPDWYHDEETEDVEDDVNIPPQAPPSVDPLFPQSPDISPRVTPRQPDDEDSNQPPTFRINYDYRKNNN